MARSMNRWFDETINIIQGPIGIPMPKGYYSVPKPEDYDPSKSYPIIQ